MTKKQEIYRGQSGFTLVELSIVLVIIGLIVGGVLAGRDMIRAAEIRSTISQLESYNTAVNTFRDKFGAIPGDISSPKAAQFGFVTRDGSAGQGDGNRQVQGCGNTNADGIIFGCETAIFWADLSSADMIDNNYSTVDSGDDLTGLATPAIIAPGDMINFIPEADLGQGNMITIYSQNGRNFFGITGIESITIAGVYDLSLNMTPQTAFNIDDKIDDGNPLRGATLATYDIAGALGTVIDASTPAAPSVSTVANDSTDCAGSLTATPDANYTYNTSGTVADLPACQLGVRASF